MKMGRWMVVLCLVVSAVGCTAKPKETDTALTGAQGPIEVSKVDKWDPSDTGKNPRVSVGEKQTVFVFDEAKRMRARLHMTQATEKFEVPLVQLRNGSEALFYGIAELEAWDWKDESGYKVMCVRCRQNVAPPEFFEPCCPNATSTRP